MGNLGLRPNSRNKWNFKQGYFRPTNPSKYLGDVNNIIIRSSLEQKFANYCDKHPNIIQWGSEPTSISYTDPETGKKRKYYPDFFIVMKEGDLISKSLVEIKNHEQATMPKPPKRETPSAVAKYLQLGRIYANNIAKWTAAKKYASQIGMGFIVLTERHPILK